MKKFFAFLLVTVLFISLSACSKNMPITCITDFSKFSTMTHDTDRIEVAFDRNTGAPFYFTIEDQNNIDEIMNIIFESSFEKEDGDMNGGDHTSIKIIQGNKEYGLNVLRIREGKHFYAFSSNELQSKIKELAREAGAYENVN